MDFKITFPDYPTKVPMTKGRRPIFYKEGDQIPFKLTDPDKYEWKKGFLFNKATKKKVIKNESMVSKPRYQSLSYNQIGSRNRIPVLKKLKEWMKAYIPLDLVIETPIRVRCNVYDTATPLHKDLDNMHTYYKAFLDLLKDGGYIPDDSKQYVTEAGGFTFVPCLPEERRLEFVITKDFRDVIASHRMYNLAAKQVTRGSKNGFQIESSREMIPGEVFCDMHSDRRIVIGTGKTKVIPKAVDTAMRKVFDICIDFNTDIWVTEGFYRAYSDAIQTHLTNKGIPVTINTT